MEAQLKSQAELDVRGAQRNNQWIASGSDFLFSFLVYFVSLDARQPRLYTTAIVTLLALCLLPFRQHYEHAFF
jgi:hypothetical protein